MQYVELFTRAFYKDYEDVCLSELPEVLGLSEHGQLVNNQAISATLRNDITSRAQA